MSQSELIVVTSSGVTAISVASANGLAGSSSGGATPALTLSTTVTGVLKGNATAISAATDADITGKLLTGYVSGAGTVAASDSILGAIQKLNGNATGGTVTTVSVATANGFAGTVATATTTPAITLTTGQTGFLAGNGTSMTGRTLVAGTGMAITNTTGGGNPNIGLSANGQLKSFGTTIDGGGTTIATGLVKASIVVPYACTITGWTLLADQTGSIVVDVWKQTYASYPPVVAQTITGADIPTISSSNKGQNLTLSAWTTAVSAGDTFRFNVNSVTTLTNVTLTIQATVTT